MPVRALPRHSTSLMRAQLAYVLAVLAVLVVLAYGVTR